MRTTPKIDEFRSGGPNFFFPLVIWDIEFGGTKSSSFDDLFRTISVGIQSIKFHLFTKVAR